MIKYQVGYGLNILFIGVNPHTGSYRRGVPFSNNKMFWYLLHDAGLLPESREILKDELLLKKLYMHSFKNIYHFGLMNIINRPTRGVKELKKGEALLGRERIKSAIKKYEPRVVCFVGKITYSLFVGLSNVIYGWQPDIEKSKIYVMHAPHHGLASLRIKDLKEIIKA